MSSHCAFIFAFVLVCLAAGASGESSGKAVCKLPLDIGVCNYSIAKYYYDNESGLCKTFSYKGCGGNSNRFDTIEDCNTVCKEE